MIHKCEKCSKTAQIEDMWILKLKGVLVEMCPKCFAEIYAEAIKNIEIDKKDEDLFNLDTYEARKGLTGWVKDNI